MLSHNFSFELFNSIHVLGNCSAILREISSIKSVKGRKPDFDFGSEFFVFVGVTEHGVDGVTDKVQVLNSRASTADGC